MKQVLTFLLVFITGFAFSQPQSMTNNFQQSLVLGFEAMHYEGQRVPLDSILIKNITRHCDTILYAPDTFLYYNYYVGIDKTKEMNTRFISSNYPNPAFGGKTRFDVFANDRGKLSFSLFDVYGRKIFFDDNIVQPGKYTYELKINKPGYYLLSARLGNKTETLKILNNYAGTEQKTGLKLIWSSPISTEKMQNQENSGVFWYEPGDTLWYIGYAQTPQGIAGSDVLEAVPDGFDYRMFIIVEGLPCPGNEAVKYAGQFYPTVQIGERCWFKENLNVGTMIPGDSSMTDNGIIEKYCYDNDTNNCNIYGGLYQWNELMNYTEEEATQGICPAGWHIPTSDDLFSLISDFDGLGCKERGNKHWVEGYNVGGSNVKGFTAYGSGYLQNDKQFYQLKTDAVFFSSTTLPYDWIWYLELNKNNHISFGTTLKIVGNTVRCIKDENK